MTRTRLIPCLLLLDEGLVKTVKFKNPGYVGDPFNAVQLFSDMEVDELIFLDIGAPRKGGTPPYELLEKLASEAFMPFSYGGGVSSIESMRKIFAIGAEKICINSELYSGGDLIPQAVKLFGSQSIVASMDVKKRFLGGYSVCSHGGTKTVSKDPVKTAMALEAIGVGEIMLTSMDRDGTWSGYDLEIVAKVSNAVSIPVIACGGAGNLDHCRAAVEAGASAVAAGSMFVYQKKDCGVLIQYPNRDIIEASLT